MLSELLRQERELLLSGLGNNVTLTSAPPGLEELQKVHAQLLRKADLPAEMWDSTTSRLGVVDKGRMLKRAVQSHPTLLAHAKMAGLPCRRPGPSSPSSPPPRTAQLRPNVKPNDGLSWRTKGTHSAEMHGARSQSSGFVRPRQCRTQVWFPTPIGKP